MKCDVCGSNLTSLNTDLPFKVSETTIVIVKGLPIFQCDNCNQFLLGDSVIDRVEKILARVDTAAELEIVCYAA
jgi:YgiT-type zinc finger domain-containing protein